MKLCKKKRVALSFVVVALSTGILIGFIVNSVITHRVIYETQERVKEALNGARWLYESKIEALDRAIYLTSLRYVLRGSLKKGNALLIKADMKRLMFDYGLDFLTLVDKEGNVLFRFHNPTLSGDSLVKDPFILKALENNGISGTQVLSRPQLLKEGKSLADRAVFYTIPTPKQKPAHEIMANSGMVLKSAHPVLDDDGNVLGALMGGILLNRNHEIVDRIKNILFKDTRHKNKEVGTATIFLDDMRISTNVIDREGNRATGTRAMREVEEQVIEKGLPWTQRAFVVDDWYITAYEPIRDIQNKIVGMLYVGILENKYAVLKERLILLFMFGMLVAVGISCFLCFKILEKEFWEVSAEGTQRKSEMTYRESQPVDRRVSIRRAVRVPINMIPPSNSSVISGRIHDISLGGMKVKTEVSPIGFRIKDEVKLLVNENSFKFQGQGEILWTTQGDGIAGIKFTRIDEESRRSLDDFLSLFGDVAISHS